MLEYSSFCYMQNQKTGCTFVESFLREFSSEPLLAYNKHAVAERRDPAKFYFINVREPLELYRSLYAYGLDGKGTVFLRLRRMGHEALYANGKAGFSQWLRFVLAPANAPLLSDAYLPAFAAHTGLMTWRFYRLAALGFENAAPTLSSRQAVNQYVKEHFFMNAVLKQESLREDLSHVVQNQLSRQVKSVPEALAWIGETPRINVSESITQAQEVPVEADVKAMLFSKERALYRNFYADAEGFAQWRASKAD